MTCRGQPRTLKLIFTLTAGGLEAGYLLEVSLISAPDKYPSWQLQSELEMRRCLALVGLLHTFSLSILIPGQGGD